MNPFSKVSAVRVAGQKGGRVGGVSASLVLLLSRGPKIKDRHHLSKGNEVNIPQPG